METEEFGYIKVLSEVGFEPTPTFVDQNAQAMYVWLRVNLESGALDRSAILTATKPWP